MDRGKRPQAGLCAEVGFGEVRGSCSGVAGWHIIGRLWLGKYCEFCVHETVLAMTERRSPSISWNLRFIYQIRNECIFFKMECVKHAFRDERQIIVNMLLSGRLRCMSFACSQIEGRHHIAPVRLIWWCARAAARCSGHLRP